VTVAMETEEEGAEAAMVVVEAEEVVVAVMAATVAVMVAVVVAMTVMVAVVATTVMAEVEAMIATVEVVEVVAVVMTTDLAVVVVDTVMEEFPAANHTADGAAPMMTRGTMKLVVGAPTVATAVVGTPMSLHPVASHLRPRSYHRLPLFQKVAVARSKSR
jgi:hypothetical protein